MPVKNRFAELLPEITAWRRDFHENPELDYQVHRTAGRVAELLRGFGVDEVNEASAAPAWWASSGAAATAAAG